MVTSHILSEEAGEAKGPPGKKKAERKTESCANHLILSCHPLGARSRLPEKTPGKKKRGSGAREIGRAIR